MRYISAILLSGALLTSVAQAGEGSGYSWSGLYLGGHAGYAWGDVDLSNVLSGIPPTTPSTYGSSFSPEGVFAGGQIGANYQIGNLVLGIESDLSWSDVHDKSSLGDDAKLDYFGTVRGRIGYAFDRVLPYVTGGFAYGHGKGTLNYVAPVAATFSDDAMHVGWAAGAGVELGLIQGLSAKLEYLYMDLGSEPYDFGYATADVGFKQSMVKLGVSYRFIGF